MSQATQESIATNSLLIPAPIVFSGYPIYYIEWRATFQFWLAFRWIHQVTVAFTEGKEFSTIGNFANFVSLEAEIACNPVN